MGKGKKRFRVIDEDGKALAGVKTKVIQDQQTGVLYLYHQDGYGGGLAVLVDREGKPLVDFVQPEGHPG